MAASVTLMAGLIVSPYWVWLYHTTVQRIAVCVMLVASCLLLSQVIGLAGWAGLRAADAALRRLPRMALQLVALGLCVFWVRGLITNSPPDPLRRPGVVVVMLIGLLITAVLARGTRPWLIADLGAIGLVISGLMVFGGNALIEGAIGPPIGRRVYASWIAGYLFVVIASGWVRRWRYTGESSSARASVPYARLATMLLVAAACLYPAYRMARHGRLLPPEAPQNAALDPAALSVSAAAQPRTPEPMNVILISIDTLRADHLGSYGYSRNTSPNIDRFFSDGATFTRAYAQSPWTLPSHMSMITGQHPSTHGSRIHPNVTSGYHVDALPDSAVTLAEAFRARGYRTAGFTGGAYLRPIFGFDQGFELFVVSESRRMREALDVGLPWIEAAHEDPFFVMLHSFDVHSYQPPRSFVDIEAPDYEGRLKERPDRLERMVNRHALGRLSEEEVAYLEYLYDTEIRVVDEQLQRLFSKLEELDLLGRTAVILTSDHGEAFAEHGNDTGHAESLWESVTRVPLMVRAPRLRSSARVDAVAQLVDIAPTALDLIGAAPLPSMQGVSLLPFLDASSPSRQVILEADARDTQAAIVFEGFKYIDSRVVSQDPLDPSFIRLMVRGAALRRIRGSALYDLSRDPGEQENLLRRSPERARAYRDLLYSNLRRLRGLQAQERLEASSVPPDLIDQLRTLGYVE